MMKNLRKKFILFAMSAVSVLLVILIGAINVLSWIALDSQSSLILHTIADGEDQQFQMEHRQPRPLAPPMNLDTIRAARFFMVKTDDSGNVVEINLDQISSVDMEEALNYAVQVIGQVEGPVYEGKIDNYKYMVKQLGGEKLIFFMDTTSQLQTFIMVLSLSTAIALVCWIAVLIFVVLLSKRVVSPIVAGMEKQRQFITNAGHELKTPLAIIQTNNDAATLIQGETKYSRNIRQQVKRLNGLMTNLLTLAKLDEEVKFTTEKIDISKVISEALPAYEAAAKEKKIDVSAELTPQCFISAHGDMILQMVSVLLDNAFKYTPEGGQVRIAVQKSEKQIIITEENNCERIDEKDPERFFERFYRGDAARTQGDDASGYGIGLSAARAIAETFGGTLTAEYLSEYPSENRIRFTAKFTPFF